MKAPAPPPLPVEQSAALRERLLDEIARITEQQEAAEWARTTLAAKNRLTAEDAKLVEDAFAQRWADLPEAPPENAAEDPSASTSAGTHAADARQQDNGAAPGDRADGSDKSLLGLSKPRRQRNKAHLRFVAEQPSLVCGRKPSDPHHLRASQPRALGRKASDEFVVPLCRLHHRLVHRVGNETAWWTDAGIDPLGTARKLWERTRLLEGQPASNQTDLSATPNQRLGSS